MDSIVSLYILGWLGPCDAGTLLDGSEL